jgi:hypothetical protein
LGAIAAIGIAAAVHASSSVELIAPRAGSVLQGGSETMLQWSASSLPAHAEEWEAFLSFDGGRYFAARITPHLDADRRSFRWRVPNVAASNVRILLRFGDEREEHAVELPQTFRIEPGIASIEFADVHAALTDASGESALPASPPVVEWVSGDRRGAGLITRRHRDATTLRGCSTAASNAVHVIANVSSHSCADPPRIATAAVRTTSIPCAPPHGEPRPLLLLLTRLNV